MADQEMTFFSFFEMFPDFLNKQKLFEKKFGYQKLFSIFCNFNN